KIKPVAKEKIHLAEDGMCIKIDGAEIKIIDSPGHASHHNVYFIDGTLFTGDIGGVCIKDGPVFPPTPPPDINIELWQETIKKLRRLNPSAICPTHFGVHNGVDRYLDELDSRLTEWMQWIDARMKEGKNDEEIANEFNEMVRGVFRRFSLPDSLLKSYEAADPSWMNVQGLLRYWRKFRS
ncbi:MAG TPA: MBL fold metallo-hydrolase, partial [bacterium]